MSVATTSPLSELASSITRWGDQGRTPVIVCGPLLKLADEFYVDLCQCIAVQSQRAVQLDVLPGHRFAGRFALTRNGQFRRLRRSIEASATARRSLALSRQGNRDEPLVIGLAGTSDHLPSFAMPIELGTMPIRD